MDMVSIHTFLLFTCVVFAILIQTTFSSLLDIKCFDRESLEKSKDTSVPSISVFKDTGMLTCMRLCARTATCRAINFDFDTKRCYLFTMESQTSVTIPGLLFNKRSFLKFIHEKKSCLLDTCKRNEQCYHTVDNNTICLPTGCFFPPTNFPYNIQMRSNSTKSDFGATLTFECRNDKTRTTTSVCMPTGQWSKLDDRFCKRHIKGCPKSMERLNKVNICFKVVYSIASKLRAEAEQYCQRIYNGSLVILDSSKKIEAMAEYLQLLSKASINFFGSYWIDGFYNGTDGQWYTRRGSFDTSFLTNGLIANSNAHCLALIVYDNSLVPYECGKSIPFICEYS